MASRGLQALAAGAAIAVGHAFAPAQAAQIGVVITETNTNGVETLSVSLAGVTISGTTNNWVLDFSATGIAVQLTLFNTPFMVWQEAPGEPGYNVLSNIGGNQLRLESEVALPAGSNSSSFCGTSGPLALGVSCFMGSDRAGNDYFVSINEVTVPEPVSLALFGVGLAGLGLMRQRQRA